MNPKIPQKFSFKENPYLIFSQEKNSHLSTNFCSNFPQLSKCGISRNKSIKEHLITNYDSKTSIYSNLSRSLKTITLNSKFYSNYIGSYSTFTQEHSFKTPRVKKYPLLKNKAYLSIKLQPLTSRDSSNEKIFSTTDRSNSIFLSFLKETKSVKKFIEKKPYGFKYGKTKIRFDRLKTDDSFTAGKDFGELCEKNLFESKFLEKLGLKKIDMNNCYEEKEKNFKFFCEYIKKTDELKDIFSLKNLHRNLIFNGRTAIKKENMEFNLDIYPLCFKFFSLDDNNKEKESQKLYFPFILMPLFYLLDFTSFKVLLSEIITFNKTKNHFEYIKENLLVRTVKKYFIYISNSLKNKNGYLDDITYNKKETIFSLIYDWIVTTHSLNEDDEEENIDNNLNNNFINNYRCYKLKIVLPKIKFVVNNLNIKINKLLNKHIIANLLRNKFNKWEKFIFFDLFSSKRFRIITNLIMMNKYYKIPSKKIKLNKNNKVHNKDYEFFLTQIGENYSIFYTFIPHIVLILFGTKEKKFQKINLNLKESINLYKFGQKWGMINTLFKCMFFDKMKNKIFFKFELLEDDKIEIINSIKEENSKISNSQKILNLNSEINLNNNFIKKVLTKSSMREKERYKLQTRYKDRMYEISLLNCSLLNIDVTQDNAEHKYYIVPRNILNGIFSIKDINKIFDFSYKDISLMGKYIGENSQSILTAKESNNIAEEKKMIEEADMENDFYKDDVPKKENSQKKNPFKKIFKRLSTFQISKSSNPQKQVIKKEIKKVENLGIVSNNMKVEQRYSNKYVFPKGIYFARSSKKRVSITNSKELIQNRFENLTRDIFKKKTFNFQNVKNDN